MKFAVGHDLHCHTNLSSCCKDERMTAENILANAAASGYDTVCFTNHLWDAAVEGASAWYAPQHIDHVRRLLPLPTAAGVRVCFGALSARRGR